MYLYRVKINLTIDIGNTRCKAAAFSGEKLLDAGSAPFSREFVVSWIQKYPEARKIFSSVISLSQVEEDFFTENGFITAKSCTVVPVISDYKSPETLGEDRWAAVCGASLLSKNSFPFLVVQIGTAITFDYVDPHGHYAGGAISPGISLRLRALHNFTGKLPLIQPENIFTDMGLTTKDSILSGVMTGCLAELTLRIDKFRKTNSESPIYIGGGDSGYFDFSHENNIFAVPNIVLVGLNHLLNLNP